MLFLLPRGLEVIVGLLKKYKYLSVMKNADVLVFSLIVSILHFYYQHEVIYRIKKREKQ